MAEVTSMFICVPLSSAKLRRVELNVPLSVLPAELDMRTPGRCETGTGVPETTLMACSLAMASPMALASIPRAMPAPMRPAALRLLFIMAVPWPPAPPAPCRAPPTIPPPTSPPPGGAGAAMAPPPAIPPPPMGPAFMPLMVLASAIAEGAETEVRTA